MSAPPFLPPWNGLGDIMIWQQKALEVQEAVEANAFREDLGDSEVVPQPIPKPLSVEASSSWV